jgi:hypothetical protein
MTKRASESSRPARTWWLSSLLFVVSPVWGARAGGAEMNVVKSIKTNQSGDVEIELKSTREFPVRDAVIELRISNQTFRRSRPGPDGSLNTIIFVLTDDEFVRINTGDLVTVGFSHEPPGWNFGNVDKTLLDK